MNGLQHFWRPPGETREPQHGIADPTPQFHSKGFNAPPLGCQRVNTEEEGQEAGEAGVSRSAEGEEG